MNYFQVINKALQYYIKEPLDREMFEYWGILIDDESDILNIKETAKKQQMYLFLSEFKNHISLNNTYLHLYTYLNEDLSTIRIDKKKTIKNALKITRQKLKEDVFYRDAKYILEDKDSREDYSRQSLKQLQEYVESKELVGVKEYLSLGNYEKKIVFTSIENIIYDIVPALPELFFTKEGYQYISKDYQIKDDETRVCCYEYVKNSLSTFCWENHCLHDTRTIDYMLTLTNIIIFLVKHKKYKELENLMEIDAYLEQKSDVFTSLVDIVYPACKTRNINLEENSFKEIDHYDTLLFLLSDEKVHEKLSNEQIAITLLYYLDDIKDKKESLQSIFHNLIIDKDLTIHSKQKKKSIYDNS